MKKLLFLLVVALSLCFFNLSFAEPPEVPALAYTTDGLTVTVSWTTVPDATGYILYYAPYPYTGPESIESIDMGEAISLSVDLWEGAAYYIAAEAYNSDGGSGYSNIEWFVVVRDATTDGNNNGYLLPDTGQTACYYTDGYDGYCIPCVGTGQDGEFTINPMSFTDNGNGTVTDNVTGLMWQQSDDDTERNWDEAGSYCQSLALAGHSDWRLPSRRELMSIVNYKTYFPAIDSVKFPGTNASVYSGYYWSSTSFAPLSSSAWHVGFYHGNVNLYDKTHSRYVRCVR